LPVPEEQRLPITFFRPGDDPASLGTSRFRFAYPESKPGRIGDGARQDWYRNDAAHFLDPSKTWSIFTQAILTRREIIKR
jgi:hypothetical protein